MSALVEVDDLVKAFPVKSGMLRRITGYVQAQRETMRACSACVLLEDHLKERT